MTDAKDYTKEDLKLAKASLLILESEFNRMDDKSEEKRHRLETLKAQVNHIRKMRIKQSKKKYDKSESGKAKNRARSLKNYYKNKSKKAEN